MKKIIALCMLSLFVLSSWLVCPVTAQEKYRPLSRCRDGNCGVILPRPEVIFIPQIVVAKNYQPITVRDMSIKTVVIGNVATTTYEMVMFNPNRATLEAEFVFPLAENQTVAAVALDINGKMREGVVVEKQKARATFENVVRRGADPLLVEKTADNQFKTRIYPFAPEGTRKIRITLEEMLKKENGQFKYVLPLAYKQKLATFSLDIEIPTDTPDLPEVTTDLADFTFTQSGQAVRSHFEAQDYELNNALSFKIPQMEKELVFTHEKGGNTYFYGDIDVPVSDKDKPLPHKIGVVWDASLSGAKRDVAKEKALLEAYLQKLGDVEVVFVPFNIKQGEAKRISVKNGDFSELAALIDGIVYDGATRFDALDLKKIEVDEFLLFSDGVETFGKNDGLILPDMPVYTINSATAFAAGRLRGWANRTFARFINLNNTAPAAALDMLLKQPLRIIRYNGENISEIYPVAGSVASENISFAGILSGAATELEIVLGYDADNIVQTHKIKIDAGGNKSAVARLWALQKMAYLQEDAEKNKDEILALGQQYSIVTENTSLLVLENASDYLQYDITPPEDLLDEYHRLQQDKNRIVTEQKENALRDAITQAKEVKKWWEREVDIEAAVKAAEKQKFEPLQPSHSLRMESQSFSAHRLGASNGMQMDRAAAPDSASPAFSDSFSDSMEAESIDMEEAQELGFAGSYNAESKGIGGSDNAPAQPKATIEVRQWDPDVPYLKILKASTDADLYADYLKLKIGYQDQPSFYFDITDEFMRRNMNEQALTVLSNITEMQLDNVELLRIAANKLLQMQDYARALELFEKITELRGEDPQSFRDLALAYQAAGEYQKAFDTFRDILEKDWGRFNPIKQIIFVEMNNLLSLHPEVDTGDLDKDFIFDMPVDIRVVLSWSTDNTDIDLHVIDPLNEECFYGHKETALGGRYPHDFTQGFGPEEFMLKKAADGKYVIRTNNFGDHRQSISGATTLYLDLYTNYARKNQKHERVFVRTENVKDKNSIGEIVWDSATKSE
ncbi:MAG: DUF2135 domain-containing protein [Alphaproteobacteria bacterium]|nr:DUF2135 domain-containing protein [Alphaproteobacteria bacterium]